MTSHRHRITNRQLGAWHRRLGLAAAAILILLVASGLLLNHGDRLGLSRIYVQRPWLLDWYGIHAPAEPRGMALGAHWLSELDGRIYFDRHELSNVRGRLKGAVIFEDTIAVAVENDIWLLTPSGAIIEQLSAAQGVPDGLRALGVDRAGRLVVEAAQGIYTTDSKLLKWRRIAPQAVNWARPMEVPPALRAELAQQYRRRELSIERVLVDMHSGRFFGNIGVWLVDLTAVACLGLAVSGLWLWARRAR
ncbi:MAG: hypothetical protein A3E57_08680 [Candidatus Muproteobacteria bacterium RIFCSPHIGHO2_12_FULL_60_33]|uniref:PepSY domain-containing protein n=1 Tax=Candidatus Muproteobacteria bacterium RIFCSPLOWO2_01_FULL_60_18 TaxID=1817768 RepID=A0A1F6TWS2_9PROT